MLMAGCLVLHPRNLFSIGSCLLLGGCSLSGEDAANQWVQSRTPMAVSLNASVVPELVDTPPAVFTAKPVADPFIPGRIGQTLSAGRDVQGGLGDRWQFADSPIDALRVVGFLEVNGRYIVVMEGGTGSLNIKVGDRLGNQQAEVIDISKQGIRLRQTDGSESWMPISRRSR